MYTIKVNDRDINVTYSEWLSLMKDNNNTKALSLDYYYNTYTKCIQRMHNEEIYINKINEMLDNIFLHYQTYKNTQEFENYFNSSIKFTEIFNQQINQNFTSTLFTHYKLYISAANKLYLHGDCFMISNNNVEKRFDSNIRQLSFIQFYSIINKINYNDALELIADNTHSNISDGVIADRKKEREKRRFNSEVLKNKLSTYPALQKALIKNQYILEYINSYKNDKSVFYLSRSYLKKAIEENNSKIDDRNVGKILLYYRTLGLINLIKEPDETIKKQGDNYTYFKQVNYYSLETFNEDILEIAEQRVKLLKENKVNIWNLTFKKIGGVFGEEFVASICQSSSNAKKQVMQPVFSFLFHGSLCT